MKDDHLELWNSVRQRGEGWYWLTPRLQAGDIYHVCSLARSFRSKHGRHWPMYLVVKDRLQASMAEVYGSEFSEIIVEPDLSTDMGLWHRYFSDSGEPLFGVSAPILVDPHLTMVFPHEVARFSEENHLSWIQLYKAILLLPASAEPSPPAPQEVLARQARAICAAHGIRRNRSVLLFPYARSFRVECVEHFARLAEALVRRDYDVFTSVAPGETEVPGTRPIFIPFAAPPEVAEHAGWAVAVRSGVCDVLSSARCRKSFVYRHRIEFHTWSLRALGLARDAMETAFAFHLEPPERFVDMILSDRAPADSLVRQRSLSDVLGESRPAAKITRRSFTEVQRRPSAIAATIADMAAELATPGSVLIVRDIPDRTHPRWGAEITECLSRLLEGFADGALRPYACRDHQSGFYGHPSPDFYEEVSLVGLRLGLYGSARGHHTVILNHATPLAALLGSAMGESILPREAVAIGTRTYLNEPAAATARAANAIGARAFSYCGVTLLDGWWPIEDWGAWSREHDCIVKVAFETPPVGGFTCRLGCAAVLAEGFPQIDYAIAVNGRHLASVSPNWQQAMPFEIDLEVPADLIAGGSDFLFSFEATEVRSPLAQGLSTDARTLGIGLIYFEVVLHRADDDGP